MNGHLSVARGPRRWLFLGLAGFFFFMASVGVALPGIPTTPFLILTSYFLIRSSPRLNEKLLSSRTFGPILRDWNEHRALRPKVKLVSLVSCTVVVGLSLLLGNMPGAARLAVAVVGAFGVWYVARLPVIAEDA